MSAPLQTAARRPGAAAAPGGGHGHLGLALFVLAAAQLMVVLDATIVNVALPHIQRALGFSGNRPGVGGLCLCGHLRRVAAARRTRR